MLSLCLSTMTQAFNCTIMFYFTNATQGTTCLFLADFDTDRLQLATVFHSCIHDAHCCYNAVHFSF